VLKVQSLREMTREELLQKKNDLLDEQFNLRMRSSLKALDNPLRLRQIRREIARLETVLTEDAQGIRRLADTKVSVLETSGSKKSKEEK